MHTLDAEVIKLIYHSIPTLGKVCERVVSMRIPLLFLLLQTVRANMRLAITDVEFE
jgi:hypothetical protein